jgi:hypothetical protein
VPKYLKSMFGRVYCTYVKDNFISREEEFSSDGDCYLLFNKERNEILYRAKILKSTYGRVYMYCILQITYVEDNFISREEEFS